MSNVGLFAIGSLVTLIVAAAMTLLVWGAILDGRDEQERRAAEDGVPARAGSDPVLHVVDAA